MLLLDQAIQTVLALVLFIGGPVIPLLLLAMWIDNWHRAHADPENAEELLNGNKH